MDKQIAENIAQQTSNVANKVLDHVDSATQHSREWVNHGVSATQRLLETGIDNVNKVQSTSLKQYDDCVNKLSNCLTNKPMQSVLVVAGVSALLALFLTRPSHRHHD